MRGSVVTSAAAALVAVAAVAFWRRSQPRREGGVEFSDDHEHDTDDHGTSKDGVSLSPVQEFMVKGAGIGQDQINNTVVLDTTNGGKAPSLEEVKQAVRSLQKMDATLAAGFAFHGENNNRPVKLVTNEVTSEQSGEVTLVTGKHWKDVAHQCRNSILFPNPPKDEGGFVPTWKIYYVRDEESALIFVLHHAVFDGTSVQRLVRVFFETLNQQQPVMTNGSSNSTSEIVSVQQLTSKMELKKSWWQVYAEIIQSAWYCLRYGQSYMHFPLDRAPGMVDPALKRETKQILFDLSENETKSLIKACKLEGTTVQGALSAAVMLSLVDIYNCNSEATRPPLLRTSHLISHWKYLPPGPSPKIAGCFIGVMSMDVAVTPSDPWTMARRVKGLLHSEGATKPMDLEQMRFVGRCRSWIHQLLGDGKPAAYTKLQTVPSISITNNGILQLPSETDQSDYRIRSRYSCSSRHAHPGGLAVLFVQTVNGRMNLSWNYYTHIWDDAMAATFVNSFQRALTDMVVS